MEGSSGISGSRPGKRRRLGERAWRELFERFDDAGLTVPAFCQREGLSRSSFNRWRSRLPMRAGAAAALDASEARQSAPSVVDLGRLGGPDTASSAGLELRLDLGGGLSLTLVRR
jgi:hypothetical protein